MSASTVSSSRSTRSRKRARFVFVLGGADSGKSELALQLCGERFPRAFLATGQALDPEMHDRIRRHRRQRRGRQWQTVEVPVHLARWLKHSGVRYRGILVDCLTLWIANLQGEGCDAQAILAHAGELLDAIRGLPGRVVVVSNEVGWGIVPRTRPAREFRSLAGKINQRFAQAADEVYLAVSGLSLRLK